jgi:GMP synthase (glutamine-hydrolysing)
MPVFILRHMPDNALGYLEEDLAEAWVAFQYLNLHDSAVLPTVAAGLAGLPDLQGLVILGGSMNVDQVDQHPFLLPERRLIAEAIEQEVPTLGICLGSQLIARSLGASVSKNPVKEIGWTPITLTPAGESDPLLSCLSGQIAEFQWHEDRFELPAGAIHLAETPDCDHQAFRLGKTTYGVQFHPEMTVAGIEQWLNESTSLAEADKAAIRADTERYYPPYQTQNRQLFRRFLKLLQPRRITV